MEITKNTKNKNAIALFLLDQLIAAKNECNHTYHQVSLASDKVYRLTTSDNPSESEISDAKSTLQWRSEVNAKEQGKFEQLLNLAKSTLQ